MAPYGSHPVSSNKIVKDICVTALAGPLVSVCSSLQF
jgi:hypothetical protein